jgi:ketosteroid isomerase-like protein
VAEHPNVTVVRASIEAFNRGDLETFAASLRDDVVWHAPGRHRYSGDFEGKATALERFRQQAEDGVRLHFDDPQDVVGGDDHVIALITLHFDAPAGQATTRSAFIMHVRAGKLAEFWAFNEDQAAVDALLGG